jgi:serine/threonine protein kinase
MPAPLSTALPYFVMEYVPGIPITVYCDQKRLSIRQRLELFLKGCEGVQHAHQKAILHRDLKPANILVNEIESKPAPHIIDFGIAKAMEGRDPLATLFTRAGHFIGTPVYISPGQADLDVRDVDTRSDDYPLAVILYELLTGSLPFDPTQWRSEFRQEQFRKLYNQDPTAPSIQYRKKTTTQASTATQTAKFRSTESQQLVGETARSTPHPASYKIRSPTMPSIPFAPTVASLPFSPAPSNSLPSHPNSIATVELVSVGFSTAKRYCNFAYSAFGYLAYPNKRALRVSVPCT